MALKTDRIHVDSQIDFFMNETAERGGIVCISTTGSGSAMDQAQQLATYKADMSGCIPLGVLMCDVVDLDLTRQHENWHKEEVQKGGKVTIWNKCTVVTNRIIPNVTPTAGQLAYISASGYVTNTINVAQSQEQGHLIEKYVVGRFLSSKDEDGYEKLSVNQP